jgi:hypothetical protein
VRRGRGHRDGSGLAASPGVTSRDSVVCHHVCRAGIEFPYIIAQFERDLSLSPLTLTITQSEGERCHVARPRLQYRDRSPSARSPYTRDCPFAVDCPPRVSCAYQKELPPPEYPPAVSARRIRPPHIRPAVRMWCTTCDHLKTRMTAALSNGDRASTDPMATCQYSTLNF